MNGLKLPAAESPGNQTAVPAVVIPVRAVVLGGLALGVAGDILLRGPGGPGLNLALLGAGLATVVWALSKQAGVVLSREASVMLSVGIVFGTALALRAAEALQVLTFFAAAVAFAIPALRAGTAWLSRSGVSDQVEAVAWAGLNALSGGFRLIRLAVDIRSDRGPPTSPAGDERPSRAPAVFRGVLLAIPFLLIFGALFVAADRVFAHLLSTVIDYEEIASHLFVTAVLTWLACGFLTGFLSGTRLLDLGAAFGRRPVVGIVEIGTALGLVNVLFGLFVAVQFRYLFGGSSLVEVTPGLTYAEYVREGFGQLAVAGALVLPSLLAADWFLGPRPRSQAVVFRAQGGLLLVFLLVIVGSALQRIRAYQAAYGLTESRFYGAAFIGWLVVLTGWFAVTVLKGKRERFAFPALLSGYGLVALLIGVNPDAWIARTNLSRADAPLAPADRADEGVDTNYLGTLSADAVPTLMDGLSGLPTRAQCAVARSLLRKWGPESSQQRDWRTWNRSVTRARDLVAANSERLLALAGNAGTGCATGQ